MLRAPRLTPSLEELSVRELAVRIRRALARRDSVAAGSPAALKAGVTEARLVRELARRSAIENIAADDPEQPREVIGDAEPGADEGRA